MMQQYLIGAVVGFVMVRWSWFVGQVDGLFKVYSGV